jgi:hypothetical protein
MLSSVLRTAGATPVKVRSKPLKLLLVIVAAKKQPLLMVRSSLV